MAMEMIIQISDILVTATATLKPLFPVDGNEPAMKQEWQTSNRNKRMRSKVRIYLF